jgi:hypothetical protein
VLQTPNSFKMKLIANRQLTGEYGTVAPGHPFEVNEKAVAMDLVRRGLARLFEVPRISYQTKILVPETHFEAPQITAEAPGVSTRQPFRDGIVHHEESAELAPESDQVFSGSDVQSPGTPDDSGRRGRGRFSPGR